MFSKQELHLIANLINAAIGPAVNDAPTLAAVHGLLEKVGRLFEAPEPTEEEEHVEDVS